MAENDDITVSDNELVESAASAGGGDEGTSYVDSPMGQSVMALGGIALMSVFGMVVKMVRDAVRPKGSNKKSTSKTKKKRKKRGSDEESPDGDTASNKSDDSGDST